MSVQSVHLDFDTLTADQQVGCLKEHHVSLRGKVAVVRVRVHELPVRQYISLLERGYRRIGARGRQLYLGPRSRWIHAAYGTPRRALSREP